MSEGRMLEQIGEALGALGSPIGISEGHFLGYDRQLAFDGRRQPAVTAPNEGLQPSHRRLKAFHCRNQRMAPRSVAV
jgi:hypothetical protein